MRATEVALLLPEVYRRADQPGSVLHALIEVMVELQGPADEALRSFWSDLDPLGAPEPNLARLAAWVGLDRLDRTVAGRLEPERLRQLVHLAALLGARRGTAVGLREVVLVASGVRDCRILPVAPFRVRIEVADPSPAQLDLVREVVAQEKPAHLVADVVAVRVADEGATP